MKRTLLVQIHPWRGYARDRELFMSEITAGWVTVAWSHHLLTDKLREFIRALRGAK